LSGVPRTVVVAASAFLAWSAVAWPPAAAGRGGLAAALATVSGARFRADVEFLADDLLEGREAGTRGYDLAARYVATELEKLGLQPAGAAGTFYQEVPLVESRLLDGRLSLERSGQREELRMREDFLMRGDLRRTEARVSGPVVFVGYGVSAPALGHDDYADVDVRGKIVAVLPDAPERFSSEERAYFGPRGLKVREAARHGAVGFLSLYTPDSEARYPWERLAARTDLDATTWLHPDGAPDGAPEALEGRALVSPHGVEKLFASAPMPFDQALAAARAEKGGALDLRVDATLESRSEHRRFSSANVIGRLPGVDPSLAATHVVLSAHLDHEGIGRPLNGDTIYNGAYDNASGAAVVLEAARALASAAPALRRSILFVFVTAEEKGLLGSAYFAAHPTVRAGSLVADVNVDMPLFLYPVADVVAFGAESSSLQDVAREAAAGEGLDLDPDPLPEEHFFVRSDQYSFVKQGVPALFLMTGFRSSDPRVNGDAVFREFLRRYYHTPADDLSRPMDLASAARFIRATVRIGWTLARADERPRWRAGSFYARTFASARAD
jgi:hypothetical protein